MSTIIFIKRKADPIKISNERGANVKKLWLDDNTPRDTVIDLGEWAGQLSEIKAIETEKEDVKKPGGNTVKEMEEREARQREEREQLRKLPPEKKLEKLWGWVASSFEMHWKFITEFKGGSPSAEQYEDFKREAFDYFDKNRDTVAMPPEVVKEAVYKILKKTQ